MIKIVPHTIYLDNPYQFCDNCKCLCCQDCIWPQNEQYSMCTDFKNGGRCSKCPGHCDRSAHYKCDIYIKYKEKEEEFVYNAKKELYEESKETLSPYERLLNETNEEIRLEGENLLKEMKEIKKSLEELDKIALKPRVLTNVENFEKMIKYESTNKYPGYKKRIEGLEIMKNQAKLINAMANVNANDITELSLKYNNIISELKANLQK